MKKSILILGFSLVGLIGFAQQNNAENNALLHQQEKNSQHLWVVRQLKSYLRN